MNESTHLLSILTLDTYSNYDMHSIDTVSLTNKAPNYCALECQGHYLCFGVSGSLSVLWSVRDNICALECQGHDLCSGVSGTLNVLFMIQRLEV